jgi:hypothetical protein
MGADYRVECGFRVVEGEQGGLTDRWRHGSAVVASGEVTFTGTVGGVRFLKRRPVRIDVLGVDDSAPREPSGGEIVSVNPHARVVRVRTPTAVLEWALVGDERRAVREATGRWRDLPHFPTHHSFG